ncbi:hypothetical protein ACRALDRAFT_1062213 [Sodiomyces alcalophilus JCM 7366]|uniref:uncharacterized protein n=1 Tax=Sodiomyces alcalophilus JCM 7366 TaxID=591952 RepID=UPI0039B56E42
MGTMVTGLHMSTHTTTTKHKYTTRRLKGKDLGDEVHSSADNLLDDDSLYPGIQEKLRMEKIRVSGFLPPSCSYALKDPSHHPRRSPSYSTSYEEYHQERLCVCVSTQYPDSPVLLFFIGIGRMVLLVARKYAERFV